MSKESLDYSILCPNYYTNWEDGCCMESCTHNDLDLCPIHYVKGLLEDKDQQIAELEAKLAEKEKERHEEWKTGKEWKWEWQKVNQRLEKADQDKISFAVEQLEKVKRAFIDVVWEDVDFAIEIIDNQIKEIKGGEVV